MDDLEARLEHQLSGLGRVPLAEPVPVADLHRRARRVRVSRALTSVVATTTAIVVVAAVVIATRQGSSATHAQKVQVAAPDFVLGDIDAVVLSSSLDADGARNPVPAGLAATVARVPGVQVVSGVVDTFAARMTKETGGSSFSANAGVPPRTPILFTYHEGEDVALTDGRAPEAQDEVIVDADVLTREHVKIGDTVTFGIRDMNVDFKIVGTFDLPGIDLAGIPLAAMSAAHQPTDLPLDRLDVKFEPGADATKVRDAIALAVGGAFTIAQPSVISFPDQRLAQLEIQHAYWALLSPDAKERSTSGVGASDSKEEANYARYADLAKQVELRVENVAFLSADAAALTFRIYYGGSPSPIITDAQVGAATRVNGHWQLGTNTLCSLAALVGIKCDGVKNVTITPPNGWEPVSALDPEVVHAFNALANPDATIAERVAAVAGGDTPAVRPMVESGVEHDRQYSGKATLTIAGWRSVAPTRIEVLYSLQTAGGPSTPWPSTAAAQKHFDGHWYVSEQFACGLSGLAGGSCAAPGTPSSSGGSKATVSAPGAATSP